MLPFHQYGVRDPDWSTSSLTFDCIRSYSIKIGRHSRKGDLQSGIFLVLFRVSKTIISFELQDTLVEYQLVIKVDRNLYFPSVERFRDALSKAASLKSDQEVIVVDFSRVTKIDHTSLKVYFTLLIKIHKEIIKKF